MKSIKLDSLENINTSFNDGYYYEDFYFDFIEYLTIYHKKALSQPDKCVFISNGVPSEMVFAAGLIPVMIESVPTLIPSVQSSEDMLKEAEQYFLNSGTCSFGRFALPAFKTGHIPLPKAFVSTSSCQDMSNNLQMLSYKFKTKHFYVDIPYKYSEDAVKYLAEQYKKLLNFLVKISGNELDQSKVSKVLENSSKTIEYITKGNILRKEVPALFYGSQMIKFGSISTLRGSDEITEIAKDFYELAKQRRNNNVSPVKNEKVRILWYGNSPLYEREFFELLEKKMGVIIAADAFCIYSSEKSTFEEKDPIIGLAKKILTNPLGMHSTQALVDTIKNFNIDGVIYFAQLNCNVVNSKTWLVKEELDKAGIPILEISGDLVDKRNSSIEQLSTRVEAFVELLMQYKN